MGWIQHFYKLTYRSILYICYIWTVENGHAKCCTSSANGAVSETSPNKFLQVVLVSPLVWIQTLFSLETKYLTENIKQTKKAVISDSKETPVPLLQVAYHHYSSCWNIVAFPRIHYMILLLDFFFLSRCLEITFYVMFANQECEPKHYANKGLVC